MLTFLGCDLACHAGYDFKMVAGGRAEQILVVNMGW